jgi:hypothetical protein
MSYKETCINNSSNNKTMDRHRASSTEACIGLVMFAVLLD